MLEHPTQLVFPHARVSCSPHTTFPRSVFIRRVFRTCTLTLPHLLQPHYPLTARLYRARTLSLFAGARVHTGGPPQRGLGRRSLRHIKSKFDIHDGHHRRRGLLLLARDRLRWRRQGRDGPRVPRSRNVDMICNQLGRRRARSACNVVSRTQQIYYQQSHKS